MFFSIGAGRRIYFSTVGNYPLFKSLDVTTWVLDAEIMMPADSNDLTFSGFLPRWAVIPTQFTGGPDRIYSFGDFGSAYVTTQRAWQSVNYPTERHRGGYGATAIQASVVLVGGRSATTTYEDSVQSYDVVADVWSDLPRYPVGVLAPAVATIGNRVYATGGRLANGEGNTTLASYEPGMNQWELLASAPVAAMAPYGAAFRNQFWFVAPNSGIWVFDPSSGTWRAERVPFPSSGKWQPVVVQDSLYMFGNVMGDTVVNKYVGP